MIPEYEHKVRENVGRSWTFFQTASMHGMRGKLVIKSKLSAVCGFPDLGMETKKAVTQSKQI